VWTRSTLSKRAAARPAVTAPRAVLFADTFTEHVDPQIGEAALEVLTAAGLPTRVVPHGCCGRPLISQGLLDDARIVGAATVDALHDAAARGEAIVFVEPSCLSALREDVPALLRGEARARAETVATASVLFEEYLERELAAGRARLRLRPGPRSVLLHPHCHQRSMGLAGAAAALLRRIPQATVTDLEAGCCGMAGSFGYAREHYDVSQTIGERKLLPAARDLASDAVLVAAGTSCRHQVAHFTAADAVHPAALLRSLLEVGS
jgi:Fe-S oxidoreductase